MSVFTPKEIEYITTQRLGRLATIDPQGRLQNSPTGFRYNADLDVIDIGGRRMSRTKKFHNIQKKPQVAFVIDDVQPPWRPRGVEIRGTAEIVPSGGRRLYGDNYPMDDAMIRITPVQIISWGLEEGEKGQNNRTVGQSHASSVK